MSQLVSFSQVYGDCEFTVGFFHCLYLFTLCNALCFVVDSMSDANGQEPQQLPNENGAEFARRLRLIATNIEEIVGQSTIDSNYLRMKAAIVEAQWLFAEHRRLNDQPPASRQGR